MNSKILVLPGDGIGPEVIAEAVKILAALRSSGALKLEWEEALVGGAALEASGTPLPEDTLALARDADAVLFGAIGGPKWDRLPRSQRPETALLALRAELGLFANLRPAILYSELAASSTLKPEVVSGLDVMIVRELTGGIYFGQPRGVRVTENGEREGFNSMVYAESEIERIARVAFDIATERERRVCSVDKANVLETSELWREVVTKVACDYPHVALSHMYVDNAAMQLVSTPKQFDVIVTSNLFGDILSDLAATLTGSIGMLPSASLNASGQGMFEPVHGSAPDIAGQDRANPLAMILSLALLLRHSLRAPALAARVEGAVAKVLATGLRTPDLAVPGTRSVGTRAMGDAVLAAL